MVARSDARATMGPRSASLMVGLEARDFACLVAFTCCLRGGEEERGRGGEGGGKKKRRGQKRRGKERRKGANWKTHKNQKSIGRLQFMSVLVFLNRTA